VKPLWSVKLFCTLFSRTVALSPLLSLWCPSVVPYKQTVPPDDDLAVVWIGVAEHGWRFLSQPRLLRWPSRIDWSVGTRMLTEETNIEGSMGQQCTWRSLRSLVPATYGLVEVKVDARKKAPLLQATVSYDYTPRTVHMI
jgi:hypothetical protein